MKIVLLEPLGIKPELLTALAAKLEAAGHTFVSYDNFSLDSDELIRRGHDADILIIANHPLKKEVIENCPNVKFISVAFVGVDHVDLAQCQKQHIRISNTAGYCRDEVAELALGLAIAALRDIPAADQNVKNGLGKAGLNRRTLSGKTVGIIGAGDIGYATAKLFKACGCKVIAYSRSQKTDLEYVSLEELLKRADIISVHTPLTADTRDLLNEKQFALMKQDAILINTARGPVVNMEAFANALNSGKIIGATDVYDYDPPLKDGHLLRDAKNLIHTPHIGFDTVESIDRRAEMAFENVTEFLNNNQIRKML